MANNTYRWYHKSFDMLIPFELYAIMQLRNEVFVVEQNCVYQDADNKDPKCTHLMAWDGQKLVAYTRLVPPGVSFEQMSIGRVVSSPAYRGSGAGKELISRSIDTCYELFGKGPIRIGAQLYLQQFYSSFGFEQVSEIYDEDGIDHIEMQKA